MAKKNEIAVIGEGSSIPDLMEILNAKKDQLKDVTESNYRNSTVLEPFGDIKNETKIDNLIKAYSSVKGREQAYNEAAKDLGLESYPQFNVGGNTAEDWKHNIQLRMAVINHADELKQLKEFEERLTKLMSVADQKAILMKDMASFFKK